MKPIHFYVHSTHCKDGDDPTRNAVVVKEKIKKVDDKGNVIWLDKLNIIPDPIRPFYVTARQFRTYQYKKEFEDISKLEMFQCRDSELATKVAEALGYGSWMNRKFSLRQLCNSPYTYGCDIETEVLIKQGYMDKTPVGEMANLTSGCLDIENEVRGEGRINAITYIHEHDIYTAVLDEYCRIYNKDTKQFKKATEEDCLKVINDMLGNEFKKHGFTLHFHIADTELSEITWIFDRIHERKTDFIGIWNMSHDIPKIIERITALGGDPTEIMCHPDVPKQYRYCKWYQDHSDVQHFTDKWHWMNLTGYSQFIDSMCLYARLRKVYGRDSSYSLDAISSKELGQGKLHFGDITNHFQAQNFDFLPYIAYNINDVLIMQLMEWKNHDMAALTGLCGMSIPSQFSRQTVMVRNDEYHYGLQRGKIPASAGMSMLTQYDEMMPKAGGTVLPPNKALGVSIEALTGIKRPTQVSILVNDLDVSSMFPSILSAFNISKETQLSSILSINGHPRSHVEVLCAGLSQPDISCMELCEIFYGYPTYNGMLDEINKDIPPDTGKEH